MSEPIKVSLTVNGVHYERSVEPRMLLSDFPRHELGLTGTHVGCEHGVCGTCTVQIDGKAVRACVTPVSAVGPRAVTTIEGLSPDGSHPVQRAWAEIDVVQCGFCQPGQIMTAAALLAEKPTPTDADIDEALSGNICRCGAYQRIRAAVHRAAALKKGA